jgi:indolepyruvate ferredoxin oxidoreductase
MVSNPAAGMPSPVHLLGRIRSRTQDGATTELDSAAAAETLLGGTQTANLLLVGAAYQAGLLPLSAAGIEDAIRINGVAVEANLGAFRWGRVAVADPAAFVSAIQAASPAAAVDSTAEARSIGAGLLQGSILQGRTREMVELRAGDLAGFQGTRLARTYIATVEKVWKAERELGERTDLSEAVAHGLHKLTAYKDEYEVARLLTAERFRAQLEAQFPGARKMRYRLHPPLLRSLGMRRKIALGPWFAPLLHLLARSKGLRGTPLDLFGYSHVRRTERMLVGHYRKLINEITARLDVDSYDKAVEAARAADLVRGYEHIKLANVDRYFVRLDALGYGHLAPPRQSNRPLEMAQAEGVE